MNYINSTLYKVFLLKFQLNHIDANYDTYNNDLGQHHQPPVGRLRMYITHVLHPTGPYISCTNVPRNIWR